MHNAQLTIIDTFANFAKVFFNPEFCALSARNSFLHCQLSIVHCQLSKPSGLCPVCPLPISLATTLGISFDFSSSAYLDVSVQRVYLCIPMYSVCSDRILLLTGFPIRTSAGQWLFAPNRSFSQLTTSFFGS